MSQSASTEDFEDNGEAIFTFTKENTLKAGRLVNVIDGFLLSPSPLLPLLFTPPFFFFLPSFPFLKLSLSSSVSPLSSPHSRSLSLPPSSPPFPSPLVSFPFLFSFTEITHENPTLTVREPSFVRMLFLTLPTFSKSEGTLFLFSFSFSFHLLLLSPLPHPHPLPFLLLFLFLSLPSLLPLSLSHLSFLSHSLSLSLSPSHPQPSSISS